MIYMYMYMTSRINCTCTMTNEFYGQGEKLPLIWIGFRVSQSKSPVHTEGYFALALKTHKSILKKRVDQVRINTFTYSTYS